MKKLTQLSVMASSLVLATWAQATVITVNTANNLDFGANKTNLYYAISLANTNGAAANTINFTIPGPGPFYIKTPTNGYPLITNHDITIDGYSQPGSAANSNPIHSPNNAQIKIVLDSRIDPNSADFLGSDMNFRPDNTHAGFGGGDVAILGIVRATNFTAKGLCLLGQFNLTGDYGMYCVAIACDEDGTSYNCHISGCWFGVDLDGTSVTGGCVQAIDNARYRDPSGNLYQITSDNTTIGVGVASANPKAEFNVMAGMIETIGIEANGARVSGNFIGVLPSGNKCYIGPIDGASIGIGNNWDETHIEIGRANNNTVIGSDLDGINDDQEGNVIGGVLDQSYWPLSPNYTGARGYTHTIEFYGNNTTINGTNYGPGSAIIANNYCGVGIDGTTPFTNGVPFSDGNPPTLRIEGNVLFNNFPTNIFDPSVPTTRAFYDGISTATIASARKNKMVANNPYPANAVSANYIGLYTKALATAPTVASDVEPTITSATTARLKGTVPVANATYSVTTVDAYIPDPVSISYGLLNGDLNEPNGWVLGKTYLGTFPLSATGLYDFDISSLNLAAGALVTVTANYTSPAGTLTSPFSAPATLVQALKITSVTRSGTSTTINWIGGTGPFKLQRRSPITGAWADVQTGLSGPSTTYTDAGAEAYYQIVGN